MMIASRTVVCGLLAACWWCTTAASAQADPSVSLDRGISAGDASQAAMQGDVILLDFAASWCGPCRQMAPIIGEITAAGWLVRHVDADREQDLVRRFGITGVPCYVLLVRGHEVGRINGATSRAELEKLLAKSREPLGLAALPSAPHQPVERMPAVPGIPLPATPAAAPLATEPPVAAAAVAEARVTDPALPATDVPAAARPARDPAPAVTAAPGQDRKALEARLLQATARLRVDDAEGMSRGTGTVIDCRQGEALILTCGHIFRDSQGKGRVEVDLFGPRGPRGVAGQVVAWDLKRDLALVSIFTDVVIDPVRVGGTDRRTATGESVVTVGCNGGDDPTMHYSRITGVDKYLGPANVQVAGQPVQGRSGGGLFGLDGTLIGVCNAADPTDNEGLFAALAAIHEQLDESGLAFVYRSIYPSTGLADAAGEMVPSMPEQMPKVALDRRDRADAVPTAATAADGHVAPGTLSAGEQALLQHVRQHGGKAEVICIVRPHGAPQAASEVFVLQGSSRAFVDHLSRTHHGHGPQRTAEEIASAPVSTTSR
jgi:thiol-disulfide isomerase/thioredoxin